MIKLLENHENIVIKGNTLQIEISKSNQKIKILSLTTNFSIDGVTPAINLFQDDEIVTLVPEVTIENSFIEAEVKDEIGTGLQFFIDLNFINESEATNIRIPATLIIKLYHQQDFCTFQLCIKTEISTPLTHSLHSLAPLRIIKGALILNENSETQPEDVTFFEQGFQSWSYTKTRTFEEAFEPIAIDVIASIHQNKDNLIAGRYMSEFITAISDIESKGSLILGFCTLADSYSRIVMDHLGGPSQISWLSAYSQFDGISINQLKKRPVSSEELFISFKSQGQGYLGLVKYAQVTKKRMNVQIHKPKVGWCSWYYYYTDISNSELLSNMKFFERSPDIPIDMLQLDDGYFTAIGDYTSFNKKFPDGLSEFVYLTHKQSKAAGIWIAPFFAAENSELFRKHPEWFLRSKKDQELLPVCYNWDQIEYALDLTHPEVKDHIQKLVNTIVNTWQFDFIKIDFIYAASVFESQYNNKKLTRAQIYREGVKLIRETMGKDKYLLGCGAPLGPSIGLVNAMRVSEDTKELWDTGNDPIYGSPCLKYALIGSINRSFMHNNFWVNDPDCLIIRKAKSDLNEDELRLQLTILGLTGGLLIISDDMEQVEEERLNLALKLIPPYPETALPVDTLYKSLPTLYLLESHGIIGERAILAIINWSDDAIDREISLQDIFHDPVVSDRFLIFDWWKEKLLGCLPYDEQLALEIPAHGCRYLGIIPFEEEKLPLFLSSTLHISQGFQEVKRIESSSNHLNLTLQVPGFHTGSIFLLLPKESEIVPNKLLCSQQSAKWGNLIKLKIEMTDHKDVETEFNPINNR